MDGMQVIGKRVWGAALDFILPPRCGICGSRISDHGHLCGTCWRTLAVIAPPFCGGCGLPFEFGEADGSRCGACLAEPPPPLIGPARRYCMMTMANA